MRSGPSSLPDHCWFALLTPRAPGGIAVVAVRGPGRAAAAASLLRTPGGRPFLLRPGRPGRAVLCVDGAPLDHVLVLVGSEQVELHLHGSAAVLERLQHATGPWGEAGTTRAQRLAQHALSDAQLALALEQDAIDWDAFLRDLARLPAAERRRAADAARRRSAVARALAEPVRLVICGAQNAGKSTLLNRLLLRDRALTGAQAGLTRDPVREPTALAGYPYLLVDTAGEGAASSPVDRRAVELGRAERADALRLLVIDGSRGPGAIDYALLAPGTLLVRSKADLPQAPWPERLRPVVTVSCTDAAVAPRLRNEIGTALQAMRGLPVAGPVGGPAALDAEQYAQLLRG